MRISDWSSDVCSSDLAFVIDVERQGAVAQLVDAIGGRYGEPRREGARIARDIILPAAARVGAAGLGAHLPRRAIIVEVAGARFVGRVEIGEFEMMIVGDIAVDLHPPERAVILDPGSMILILVGRERSEEHQSELQSLIRLPYA